VPAVARYDPSAATRRHAPRANPFRRPARIFTRRALRERPAMAVVFTRYVSITDYVSVSDVNSDIQLIIIALPAFQFTVT
jgi:hypothetical protein